MNGREPRGTAPPTGSTVTVQSAQSVRRAGRAADVVERVNEHVLILPACGDGRHSIDFETYPSTPGWMLHIQPGQVHRWLPGQSFEARVISIRPDHCPAGLFNPSAPVAAVELGEALPVVQAVTDDIMRAQASSKRHNRVMVASAALLLHHVAGAGGWPGPEPTPQAELFRAFQCEVEASFAATRSVSHYARTIGTSQKTLSRATAGLVGSSPKEIIDRRVILEARRLLAHTAESASSIGSTLGFSEPTNFTKFFVRHTGMSPQEFRVEI